MNVEARWEFLLLFPSQCIIIHLLFFFLFFFFLLLLLGHVLLLADAGLIVNISPRVLPVSTTQGWDFQCIALCLAFPVLDQEIEPKFLLLQGKHFVN